MGKNSVFRVQVPIKFSHSFLQFVALYMGCQFVMLYIAAHYIWVLVILAVIEKMDLDVKSCWTFVHNMMI